MRQHDHERVRALALLAEEAAEVTSYREYVATAKATQAWLAWQEGRSGGVKDLAADALEIWGSTAVVYSHCWVGIFPLLATHVSGGQLAAAVELSRRLLEPPQQRLAAELEAVVGSAIAAWDDRRAELAKQILMSAVEMAQTLRYA